VHSDKDPVKAIRNNNYVKKRQRNEGEKLPEYTLQPYSNCDKNQ